MRFVLSLLAAAALVVPSAAAAKTAPKAPAPPTAASPGPHSMVAAANPAAVEAGLKVLRAGGSAADAAVAVQATLGLVEPQSSGLGGGAFMTFYDAKTHKVTSYDGREFAPAGATPDMFMAGGKPMSYAEAVLSGRSAGTPGAIAMLYLAQKEHGVRPWSSLFGEGERLATEGFVVGPRLEGMINSKFAPQAKAPDVVRYFTNADGSRVKAGDRLKNPAYAATLRLIAAQGPNGLLKGKVAADIVRRLSEGPTPGTMTLADLAAYKPRESEAICRPYRVWIICAPDLPSGGSSTLEGLGLLERTDIASRGPTDPQAWLELAQAERLMYADRDLYVGDPAFVKVPLAGLLDPAYLDERAKLIGDQAGPAPAPGHPPGAPERGPDATREPGGTTSFVIVDKWGNVVSMTTTVESIFGDGRMVDGFLLNNQLTDFSFSPVDKTGAPAANAVAPHKRPRSAMTPVIILDKQGRLVGAVGSPGGPSIIAYVMKAVVGVLDWKLSMQDAVALPNLVARGDTYSSEPEKYPPGVVEGLAAKGVVFRPGFGEDSGLHGVVVKDGHLEGGADPRREGVARGF